MAQPNPPADGAPSASGGRAVSSVQSADASPSGTSRVDTSRVDPPTVDTSSYTRSEATRLLCAGAYLDAGFRDAAIAELIEHPERPVPPSLGCDVAAVLRHCLRARSMNVRAASLVLAVLAAGALVVVLGATAPENPSAGVMTQTVLFSLGLFLGAGLMSVGRHALLGRSASLLTASSTDPNGPVGGARRLLSLPLGLINSILSVLWILPPVVAIWNGEVLAGLAALTLPVLLITIGVWHQLALSRTLWTELTRRSFTGRAPTPLPLSARRLATLGAIDREQFSPLVLYNEDNPFLGAGAPFRPWSLTLELERRPDAQGATDSPDAPGSPEAAEPLDGRRVLDLIVPQLTKLAEVSSRTSRDRLKDLELQECVFLPAALPRGVRRVSLPYADGGVRRHLTEAAGEGAEQRRHFLRIRVGGWEEEVVTTVFVRVHTQGDLLILEVLPYVLPPLRPVFHEVDALSERLTRFRPSTLVTAPAVTLSALASAWSTLRSNWFEWRGPEDGETFNSPRSSIRELGSRDSRSMFQEMDVSRYVRTIQDRITSGTKQALTEAGYLTEEFQQQVVNISRGGVFIGGSMTGSFNTGTGGRAVTVTDPTATKTTKTQDKG